VSNLVAGRADLPNFNIFFVIGDKTFENKKGLYKRLAGVFAGGLAFAVQINLSWQTNLMMAELRRSVVPRFASFATFAGSVGANARGVLVVNDKTHI
jgi:hypothetical protein